MSSYSLTITSGAGTYAADGTATVQPDWKPSHSYEWNTDISPAQICADIETWTLQDFVFVASTPGAATTDWANLVAILNNRASPISSVQLKFGGSTVFNISTSAYAQVWVRGLESPGGKGAFATHWRGTVVVSGRKVLPDGSGIVRLDQKLANSWNRAGLQTQTLTGRLEVAPQAGGASATLTTLQTALTALVPASLGASYVYTTGGALGTGPANIDYEVLNASNTVATFRSQQQERGLTIPPTAVDFLESIATSDGPEGRTVAYRANATGSTIANALTAARTIKPQSGVAVTAEQQDLDSLTVTATYSQTLPLPAQSQFFGATGKIVDLSRSLKISGGGQQREIDPIPGYLPFETLGAWTPITITETVSIKAIGVASPADIPLTVPLLDSSLLQSTDESIPTRTRKAEMNSADPWTRTTVRTYQASDPASIGFDTIFAALLASPAFMDGETSDYKARLAQGVQ